jgi:hypothetical protein
MQRRLAGLLEPLEQREGLGTDEIGVSLYAKRRPERAI